MVAGAVEWEGDCDSLLEGDRPQEEVETRRGFGLEVVGHRTCCCSAAVEAAAAGVDMRAEVAVAAVGRMTEAVVAAGRRAAAVERRTVAVEGNCRSGPRTGGRRSTTRFVGARSW